MLSYLNLRRLLRFTAIALIAVYYSWWVFFSGDLLYTHARNAPNRIALTQLHSAINLGASHLEVLTAYWRFRTIDLQLRVEEPAKWVISMPFELLEDNWELWIEFGNGTVTALRVRTPDEVMLKDGPKDREMRK